MSTERFMGVDWATERKSETLVEFFAYETVGASAHRVMPVYPADHGGYRVTFPTAEARDAFLGLSDDDKDLFVLRALEEP